MRAKCAIAILIAFGVTQCDSLWEDSEPTTEVEETGSELSGGDILEDMLDYLISEDDAFEGRKKKKHKKKLMKYLAAAALFKALLLPKLFALVKFLTAKAYLLSILALVAAAAVTSKKKEQNTEHVINLLPKGRSRDGTDLAFRYWRGRRLDGPE